MREILSSYDRNLKVDLTDKEVEAYGRQLAKTTSELSGLEDEKKSVVSEYASKINRRKAILRELSVIITNGYEYKPVEVRDELFVDDKGLVVVETIRVDTLELVETRKAMDAEKQRALKFEQPTVDAGAEDDKVSQANRNQRGRSRSKRVAWKPGRSAISAEFYF